MQEALAPVAMELLMFPIQDYSEELKEEIQWELEERWAQLLPTPHPQQGEPVDLWSYV